MNQAEVIHTGWVYRDRPNLSMLEVCLADSRDCLFPDVELKDCQSVVATGGPSYADWKKKRNMLVRSINQATGPDNVP